jgi:hypothetical protein
VRDSLAIHAQRIFAKETGEWISGENNFFN